MTATLSRRDRTSVSDQSDRQADPATRRWVKQAWESEGTLTRAQLLTYAQTRIATLTGPDAPGCSLGWTPVHSAVASFAMWLLGVVVADDDLATPQVAPTPDGGLDIQWLVAGDSLEITIDLDDGVSLVGRLENGEYAFEPFDWDFDDDVNTLVPMLVSAGSFLEKISTGIQHRLPIR
jgi:hypothetical protein